MSNLNDPSPSSPAEHPSEAAEAGGVPPNGPISLQPVPPAPTTTASHAAAEGANQSRQGLTPDTLKAELARLDSILVALLFVFAFFLGSTVARNSDVWQHLATGRLISAGQYSFGSDPFSYTSAGRAWINHSWLADLLAYKLWESLGGIDSVLARAGLVLLKASLSR